MGTTAQKLQKALDNKQLIVDSVNAKAGTAFTINSKPSDIANTITNIETGNDTSDATATASDILKGKTAYTVDGKVEGTIEKYNGDMTEGAEQISGSGIANGLPLEVNNLPGSGTAVPNSGTVENVYVNTSLNAEKVFNLLKGLTYTNSMYVVLATSDNSNLLGMQVNGDINGACEINIVDMNMNSLFIVGTDGTTFVLEYYKDLLEVNAEVTNLFNGISVGTENDKLANLFSITPFGDSTGVEGAIYKVGSGKEQFSDLYINIPSSGMATKLSDVYTVLGCETVEEKPLENIKESTQTEFYLYYDKSANDIFVYIDIGYGLMWVDCSSMLAAENFTGLTFKGEITNINQATEEGYYVFISSGGEVVPNSGYVKQVYLNTNLSVEKVKALIDEVIQEGDAPEMEMYVVIYNGDEYIETTQLKGLMFGKVSDGAGGYRYFMMIPTEENEEYVFAYYDGSTEIEEFGFSGWNPDFKGVYEFNSEATNTAYGGMFTVGESNDKLMDLLSLTSTFGSSKTTYYLFENGEFKRFLSSDEAGLPIEVNELPSTDFIDVMVVNEVSGESRSFNQECIMNFGFPLKCITVETEPNPDELILTNTTNGVVVYYIKNRNDLFIAAEYEGSLTLLPFSSLANEDLVDVPEYTFLGTYVPGVSNKHGYYIVPGKGDVTEGAIYKVDDSDFQAYVYEEDEWMNFSMLVAVQMGGKITINLVDTIPDASQMKLSDTSTLIFEFYYVEGDDKGYATADGVETFTTGNLGLPPVGGIVQSVEELTDTSKMYIVGKKGGYYIYENGWKELIPQDNYNSGSVKPEQEKSITPTTSVQEVTPDNGYALSKVTVGAIPSEYVIPTGTKKITTTGEHDVTSYAKVNVDVPYEVNIMQKYLDEGLASGLFAHWGVSNFDTYTAELDFSKVSTATNMFESCHNSSFLTSPIMNFTNKLEDTLRMFSECKYLKTITLFDTSGVTNMSYMFDSCSALTSIPQFDTSNVTNMVDMFKGCSSLTTIPQFDTSNVTNMVDMFNGCTSLTSIPQFDTKNCEFMTRMFSDCTSLRTVPPLDTSSCTSINRLFYNCSALETIDISNFDYTSADSTHYMAQKCSSLKAFIIRNFGANYVLGNTAFWDSGVANGTGYIYVPRAMVDTLKSATNWSTHASQIRALEDYTVDGTITGALDKTKI